MGASPGGRAVADWAGEIGTHGSNNKSIFCDGSYREPMIMYADRARTSILVEIISNTPSFDASSYLPFAGGIKFAAARNLNHYQAASSFPIFSPEGYPGC